MTNASRILLASLSLAFSLSLIQCSRQAGAADAGGEKPSSGPVASSVPSLSQIEELRARFLEFYRPIVKEKTGLGLEIKLDEESPQYFGGMTIEGDVDEKATGSAQPEGNSNAKADRNADGNAKSVGKAEGKTSDAKIVILIGSRAHEEPGVTADSYLALLCHEVGHRLAGAPFSKGRGAPAWSSAEGQCDYFAASDCMKRVFSADPRTQQSDYTDIPAEYHKRCEGMTENLGQAKVCLRVIKSGRDFAETLYQIYRMYPGNPRHPELSTPEAAGGSVGMLYPSMQCRLDTYVAGALSLPRPACWFE